MKKPVKKMSNVSNGNVEIGAKKDKGHKKEIPKGGQRKEMKK